MTLTNIDIDIDIEQLTFFILPQFEQSLFYDPYASTLKYMTPYVSLPLESVVVAVYCVDCFLRIQTARPPMTSHGWLLLKCTLSVLVVIDIAFAISYIGPVNISYYKGRNLTMSNLFPNVVSNASNFVVSQVNPNLVTMPSPNELPSSALFRLSRFVR